MIPEKMDAANTSIFTNSTRNSTDSLLNQSAEHFMLLFEDIDQYFNHLNLSNDTDYATYDRQLFNCSLINTTNISCIGHQPESYTSRNYWALVLVLFPIFTLFGNVLVILSVYRERTLQSATNYFIVSLALADLLVAVVVMPFAVYVLVIHHLGGRSSFLITAKATQDTPQHLISSLSTTISVASTGQLPQINSIRRTIRNVRKKEYAAPALPRSRDDLIIFDLYKHTNNGENFLLFDSGNRDDRILIFGTECSLDILKKSQHWFMDGTFKTVPHLFNQLYTIHGLKENLAVPLLYILLPDKREATYTAMLCEVKRLCHGAEPNKIMIDFEKSVLNAITTVFKDTTTKGCFFHFCQCIYRKIQSCGLKHRYDNDPEFSLKMRMLNALAFVPLPHVVEAFNQLCDSDLFPEEAQVVIDYFEDTWIGRPDRRHRRRPPVFPHIMWNCFDAVSGGIAKTNNAVEGWHRSFESQISANHPSIWKFLDGIKREHALSHVKIEQYLSGAPPSTPRKKYKDCADRIRRKQECFDPADNILSYLRGIAHNINY